MRDILAWLQSNMNWAFSGIGVLAISTLGTIIFKRNKSAGKNVTQNPSITQSPSLTQAPVLNITNNISGARTPLSPAANTHSVEQISLIALPPAKVTRNVSFLSGRGEDQVTEVCI